MKLHLSKLWRRITLLAFLILLIAPMLALNFFQQQSAPPLSAHSFGIIELGVFVALVAQVGAFFSWGSRLKTMIEEHEKRLNKIEERGSVVALEAARVASETADDVAELRHRLEQHINEHLTKAI